MNLDHPDMIIQAKKSTPREVEILYWHIEDAIYNSNKDRAKSILNMVLYIAKHNSNVFHQGLQLPQKSRLKEITHELNGDKVTKEIRSITIKTAVRPSKLPFKIESQLRDYLVANKSILSRCLGDNIDYARPEVEVNEYKCDIVAENNTALYAIELKIGQGNHAVVSQCSKYCYYFYRKLRYDRFKIVQGVVIGNGFDSWSINELRREGHWIYNIIPLRDSESHLIELKKVD